MNALLESMQSLQRMVLNADPANLVAREKQIAALRAGVPAPVLAHFDRLIKQGRKGVAEVHHGVCGACHLKLPGFQAATRPGHEDLALCEHCGAYLVFVPESAEALPPAVHAPRKRRYRATALPVAVAS
jgi:predicted  nucleic acid-binding Zn-ribbon protein